MSDACDDSACRGQIDLRTLVAEQAALNRVAVTVATETAAERVFDVVTEEVARLLGADAANLVRFGPTLDEGVIVGSWSEPGVPIPGAGTIVWNSRRRAREGRENGRAGSAGHRRPRCTHGAPRAADRTRCDVRRSRSDHRVRGHLGRRGRLGHARPAVCPRTPRSRNWGSSPASSRSRSRTPRPARSLRLWPTSKPPSAGWRSPLRPRRNPEKGPFNAVWRSWAGSFFGARSAATVRYVDDAGGAVIVGVWERTASTPPRSAYRSV